MKNFLLIGFISLGLLSATNKLNAQAPTVPANNLALSSSSTSSLSINWTRGNGDKCLVVCKLSSSGTSLPQFGNDYTGSSTFGNGSNLGNSNYVVYEATGTSMTIYGLTANTYYNIRIYEFNIDWVNVEYYLTAQYETASYYTLANPPSTAPSLLNAYSFGPTYSYFSWTPGNGTNHILGLRQSTALSGSPSDGTDYSSTGYFGSGTTWGSTSPYTYAMYDGTATSGIYCYNLLPQTNYAASVYTFNGTGGANNYLISPSSDYFTTLATEPSSVSSNLYFTDITDNAMTIHWMKPTTGGGTYSLVTIKAGTTNNNLPSDTAFYTPNTVFGSGEQVGTGAYTVYTGAGNTVRVTGLTTGTFYCVSVFEYNGWTGTFNNTTNYYTGSYSTDFRKTNDPQPTTATSGFSLTPSTNSINASWTNGNGSKRIVAIKPTSGNKTALMFDNTNDYVSVPFNSLLQPTGTLTVECWAYKANWNVFNGWHTMAGNYEGTGGYQIFTYDNYFYGYVRRNNGDGYVYIDISYLTPGWHHFAMTYDGRYTGLIVDGARKTTNDAGAVYPIQYQYSNSFIIGADAGTTTTPTGNYFDGALDEVRVWNQARSLTSIWNDMEKTLQGNESGLIAEWRFDDGFISTSTAKNHSIVNSLNGTLVNTSTTFASSFSAASGWIYSASGVDNPIDFSAYNDNSVFGSGTQLGNGYYVVYKGTGTSVNITGLTQGTRYNVAVFEFNDALYQNYLISNYTSATALTLAQPLPTITTVSPVAGTVGTLVTLTGTNFSTTPANNTVYFGAERATVVSSTATQIVAIAPYCTDYAPISVTVNNATGYSNVPFIINSACNSPINSSSLTGTATTTGSQRMGVVSNDMDLDGKADLVYVDYLTSQMSVVKNQSANGVIAWGTTTNFSVPTGPIDLIFADFDGDGKEDPAILSYGWGTLNVYRNTSTSSFSLGPKCELAANSFPWALEVADFDRDGKPDIVVVNSSGTKVSIYRNTSVSGFLSFDQKFEITIGASLNNVAVGDMNNDGRTDIICGDQTNNGFYAIQNNSTFGNLIFGTPQLVSTASGVQEVVVGDLNNNGKLDVGAALTNGTVRIFNNINAGGAIAPADYALQTTLTTQNSTPNALEFNDIDGDSRPDIVVGYSTSNNISVFEHTAIYTFAARVDYVGTGSASPWLTVNDFSLDGKSDVVSTNWGSTYTTYNNALNPLSSEPTVASSALNFTGVSQTQLTLNFTAGNGTDRIVVARAGGAVSVLPFDGVGYTPNTVFGLGTDLGGGNFVVYNNNGNNVTVTGLQSNTQYFFAVFEYNGASTCQNNYLTTSFGNSNTTTLNTPPTINSVSNPSAICQNSGLQTVNLSGIGTGALNETQTLAVTATSNNQTLIPNGNISVNYTSPNATGLVNYTSATNQSGTATITVTVNDNASNNNTTVIQFTVTVNAPPTSSAAGPNQNICTPSTTLAGNTPTVGTGTWSIIYTSNGSITITNINSPASAINNFNTGDSVRLAWTITNAPCSPSSSQMSVKRGTCPLDAEFSANQTNFCGSSANVTYTNSSTCQLPNTITNWAWTFPGGTPNSATGVGPHNVAYTLPGTYNAQLIITNNIGTTNTELKTNYIVITALPAAAPSPTGNNPVCQGQTSRSYSVTNIVGATTYQWSVPANYTIVSGQGTQNIIVDIGANATTGNITVQGVNSCGNGTQGILLVTVNPLPANTGVITGPTTVCQGQNGVAFSVPAINNATGYNWTLPSGATIITGNNTNSITVDFSTSATSGTVNVIGTNSCGNGTSVNAYTLTVNPLPDNAGAITGLTTVCQNDTVSYSISALSNATSYNWTIPSGATIISGNNTNAITVAYSNTATSGNVTVLGVNPCGNGVNNSIAVTVSPLPGVATTINGNNTICAGDNNELFFVSNITNATSYAWTLPQGFTIISGNNTNGIVVALSPTAQSGTISVYGTNACGDGASSSLSVTVNPLPDSAGTIVGTDTVCQGQLGVAYSVPTINNASDYSWTVPSGASIVTGNFTNSITVDFSNSAQSGYVTVIGGNICGDGLDVDSFMVTVNPLPDAAGVIVGDSAIGLCPSIQVGVVYTILPVANATGYNWTVPNGATIVNGNNTNSITVDYSIGAQSGNISVVPTNACGTGAMSTTVITVDTVPGLNICMVTVNTNSSFNNIMWDKPVTTQLDSFRVYREIGNQFVHIGSVHYDSLSIYVDSVYVPIADPNNTSYRYKISAVDTCGNESALSEHHRTIFLQANQGVGGVVNLNWVGSTYEGNTVDQYYIFRDTTGSGPLILLDSVPGMNAVYTDNNPSSNPNTLRYVLGVDWQTVCNPTLRMGGGNNSIMAAINNSNSNIKNLFFDPNLSIGDWENYFGLSLYPNPNNGQFQITFKDRSVKNSEVKIFDAVGQVIYNQNMGANKNGAWYTTSVDISSMANGVYYVQVVINGNTITKKLVIQK